MHRGLSARVGRTTVGFALAVLVASCDGGATPPQRAASPPAARPHVQTTPATPGTGDIREFALPQKGSGTMRPAIDRQGRIWFGEMGHNCLTVFDPRTQAFTHVTPPRGRSGIMGLLVAEDDTIWFAEQYANYIGHYFPARGAFETYDLPTLTRPDPGDPRKTLTLPNAPNDLAFDARGNVWFTESNANAVGVLDIRTRQVRHYSLVGAAMGAKGLDPYGIAIDPAGIVWFTSADNDAIGRLDPATGAVRSFRMPGLPANVTLMELASDTRGVIWATSFTYGLLLRFDPRDGAFAAYYAPPGTGGVYGLATTESGDVWVTVTDANAVARLDVAAGRFTTYAIPTKSSLPFGVALDRNLVVWFTEAGGDKLGMLRK